MAATMHLQHAGMLPSRLQQTAGSSSLHVSQPYASSRVRPAAAAVCPHTSCSSSRCNSSSSSSSSSTSQLAAGPSHACNGSRCLQQPHPTCSRRQPQRRGVRCRVVSPEQPPAAPEPAAAAPPPPPGAASAVLATAHSMGSLDEASLLLSVPEAYELPPGVLSSVDRTSPPAAEDAFRCPGCTKQECQTELGCADNMWRWTREGYVREILTARVYDVAVQTPLDQAEKLSEALGNTLLLKREDLQPVFSFKLRGAFNKMAKLSPEALARGVVTSSAGNHAQGVALAASKLGCTAIICMPTTTPEIKVTSVQRLGGQVVLIGESYQEAQAHAQELAVRDGLTFVAPYDDPHTIAGQGTIGDEILRQIKDPSKLDAIFVAIGGGGLVAGIAAYVKALYPHIQIIGVEPCGANAMAMSLAQGRRATLSRVDAFADGVAVKQVGAETFRLCRQLVDGVLLVDNAAISAAIKDVFNETRNILEPAGAVAVAGAKAWLKENRHKGKTVVAVTSGANINFERLRLVSELADLGASTEVMMATTIPECPGAFKQFVEAATGGSGSLSVTEFKYRYSAGAQANILWSAGVKDRCEVADVIARLEAANMPTLDISGMDAARIHLRHLVGGRARSYMGEIPNERMFQVQFPERPGALRRFLSALSADWNVTLFHYRNTGNRESYVMLGMQVPPEQDRAFRRVQKSLQDEFSFEELDGEERRVFNMFIS